MTRRTSGSEVPTEERRMISKRPSGNLVVLIDPTLELQTQLLVIGLVWNASKGRQGKHVQCADRDISCLAKTNVTNPFQVIARLRH